MEHASHPCHQCNAEVEEGTPFCRKCGAPQIRVSREGAPEQRRESASSSASGADALRFPGDTSTQKRVDRRLARRLAALSGLLLVVIMALSSSSALLFLLIPIPGALTVGFYLRRRPGKSISLGVGTGLGLLTGLFGALLYVVPSLAFLLWCLTNHPDWRPVQDLRSQIEHAVRTNPQLQQIAPFLLGHNGLVFMAVMGSVVLVVLTLVLSAIGGAVGAALFRRRQ